MDLAIRRPLLVRAALVWIAFGIQQGCVENRTAIAAEPLSWDSPRMREIEKEWQSWWDTYDNTPEKIPGDYLNMKYGYVLGMLYRVLRHHLSEQDLRQLAASCETLPMTAGRDRREFVNDVLVFMVTAFVEMGDRKNLVKVLSTRCPSHILHHQLIEFYLAFWGNRLKDPILILGEAYAQCRVPEVRHDLAAAVRRGFAGLGIRGKNDAEFVRNAMRWYEKQKDGLIVNWDYRENEILELDEFSESRRLLFNKKPLCVEGARTNQKSVQAPCGPAKDHVGRESPASADSQTRERELGTVEGTWKPVEVVDDGEIVPQEKIKGGRFVFSKETLTLIGPDGKKDLEYRVSLDPRQDPRAIDFISITDRAWLEGATTPPIYEETKPGIYKLTNDCLRICLARPWAWRRPTCFKAEQGSRLTLITLKRLKARP